jgi:hypothetical protein
LSLSRLRDGLLNNQAETHPEHLDPRLRGRTYAIPFARVWAAALEIASRELPGWTVLEADEDLGVLKAESQAPVLRFVDDVELRMSLDENGQTRVDMTSESRVGSSDLGKNARRIRRFFRILDQKIGAGPKTILDPTLSLFRTGLLLLICIAACSPAEEAQDADTTPGEGSSPAERNFQGTSYERNIVFLTAQGDSTLLVPWSFFARTREDGVDREVRGWLARSDQWEPFFFEQWETPPSRSAWRILPRGSVRLLIGLGEALEGIVFQDGVRNLEVTPGDLLVEWSGLRAQTFRVQEGTILLSDRSVEGFVLDMSRAWAVGAAPPGDWGFLISGDSLQVVMEDLAPQDGPQGGNFSLWTRVESTESQYQDVRMVWSEVRAFEPARRDVPVRWEVQAPNQEIAGSFAVVAPLLEAGEGEGPVLPVDGLFQVAGTLTFDGRDFPVRGFIHHSQR